MQKEIASNVEAESSNFHCNKERGIVDSHSFKMPDMSGSPSGAAGAAQNRRLFRIM